MPQPSLIFKQALDAALRHHQARRYAEAETFYKRALAIDPEHPEALHLYGLWAYQNGQAELAERNIRRAIGHQPRNAAYHNSLAAVLISLGRMPEAEAAARAAIALSPNLPEAFRNLGNALSEQNRNEEAAAAYQRSLQLAPQNADAHFAVANVLRKMKRWDAAIASYQGAIQLRPNFAEALNNLGATLRLLGKIPEAMTANQRALQVNPNNPRAYSNLATTLGDMNDWTGAIEAHRRAIALQPADPHFHWNLSLALLTIGQFREGWAEFEYRWGCRDFPSPVRGFAPPLWNGEPLNGRRILLYAEQGFGDTIQFVRYAPMVAGVGGRVFLEVHPELHKLLQQTPGVERVIARGQPLPEFDLQCPLMSLPRALETVLETIPSMPAKLYFDPARAEFWQRRVSDLGDGRKIGLVWGGQSWHPNDHNRSIAPKLLEILAAIPNARFISLQKGRSTSEIKLPLSDWTRELDDFSDTAALVIALDLVISVDTAVAHLAASLGKPTMLLLPFSPDFRWLLDRSNSPWYPTMRLYRQATRSDWTDPLQRIAADLS